MSAAEGTSPLRGLLVDDSASRGRRVVAMLREVPSAEVELRRVASVPEAERSLLTGAPDFTLLDLELSEAPDLEALERIRGVCGETPLIVLTRAGANGAALEALQAGADNYLHAEELSPALLWRTISSTLERKRVESTLRQNRAFLNRVLETVAEGVLILDADGTIRYANRRAAEIHGMPLEKIQGSNAADDHWRFRTPAGVELEPRDHVFARVFASGRPVEGVEQVLEHPRRGRVVLSVNGAPLHGDDGGEPRAVISVRDITGQKELQEELEHRALYDTLTELPNRGLLWDRLAQASARADRLGRSLALIFVDIDRFKVINDGLGHVVGDQLLQAVARRLKECLRTADSVARFGGDEFVVLVEDIRSLEVVRGVADRLAGIFDEPFRLAGEEHPVSGSIGVALRKPGGGDPEEVLHRADRAMYRAKQVGSTDYEFYDRSLDREGADRLQREAEMRRGIREGQFTVEYQPIVNLGSREVVSLEALVRWRHPERGMLSPDEFIPLAEESGLIVPLGEKLLESICGQVARWRASDAQPTTVCVNLSARQLADPELASVVARLLEEHGVPARAIEFEVTERLAMETTGRIEDLTGLGVRVAIDDFGTGYSSLGMLKRIDVDALKVDQSFVAGLGEDLRDRAIVETILTLGRTLGMVAIAEGVETEEQASILSELGCLYAQGYLFARPAGPEACGAWLEPGVTLPAEG